MIQYSGKLVFGNVAIFGSIEVLEVGFHQYAFVLDLGPEMSDDFVQFLLIIIIQILILTSGWDGGFTVDLLHLEQRVFIDVVLGEDLVHIVNKLFIAH